MHDFPAEVARLALIIAEYQCDVLYCGQKEALAAFLPLDAENWIINDNALKIDWLSVCPAFGTSVKLRGDDLFSTPLKQPEIDFDNEGGEIYVCGNPPYLGSKWQTDEQKSELKAIFDGRTKSWKILDYVAGWFMKAADYGKYTNAVSAFVSTNSICQGQQVPILWPLIFRTGHEITFAHTSFKWANLASNNAGVTVVIVGISNNANKTRKLFSVADDGGILLKEIENINAYLAAAPNIQIEAQRKPFCELGEMQFGNHPYYGSALIFSMQEANEIVSTTPNAKKFIRPLYGSQEFISNQPRACLWIEEKDLEEAIRIISIAEKIKAVKEARLAAKKDLAAQKLSATPYRFRDQFTAKTHVIAIPRVSSENRPYLPTGLLGKESILQDAAIAMYDAPLWNMAIIASKLHSYINGQKVTPFPKAKGTCDICGAETLAKCGEKKIWHWAHKSKLDCDPWWENETEWHREWKEKFPESFREIVHRCEITGEKHRADIKSQSGIILEIQNSPISLEELRSREAFYKNLLWIVNGKCASCRNAPTVLLTTFSHAPWRLLEILDQESLTQ